MRSSLFPLALASVLAAATLFPLGAQSGAFLDGAWEGSVNLGDGPEPLVLRIFPADPETEQAEGGLVDLPARQLFGYPMDDLERVPEGLIFSLLDGAPFAGRFELEGAPVRVAPGQSFAVTGFASILPAGGSADATAHGLGPFTLSYSGHASRGVDFGLEVGVDTGRGILPGSLLLPNAVSDRAVPAVLLLSGADADRDGNNYAVPGRSDALAQLARALRERGIASLRFDQRGSGEAYRLGADEGKLRFDDRVADARAAIVSLAVDLRFSRLVVLGYGEGALVGAAALGPESPVSSRVVGLVALCASGKTELETIEEALSSTPEAYKPEAEAIMSALEAGKSYPNPSPYFADFFRPSVQAYLASRLGYDVRAAFAAARPSHFLPRDALVIAGGSDLQVSRGESQDLASARPGTAYRVIPGMSHALKEVGDDEDANYSSFTDPSLPLAKGLVDLVAAFVDGEALPGSDALAPVGAAGSGEAGAQGPQGAGEDSPR